MKTIVYTIIYLIVPLSFYFKHRYSLITKTVEKKSGFSGTYIVIAVIVVPLILITVFYS
jgi:hypothetical protein